MSQKVFGIGFSKTGTKTLAECLRRLGYRHHEKEASLRDEVMRGDLRRMFEIADRYDSFDEWPWAMMYRELDQRYPEARFVLTVRKDARAWLRSVVDQSERLGPTPLRERMFGHGMPHGHEAEYVAVYEEHNRAVLEYFAGRPDKLLVVCWENGSGWEELCRFLGKPVVSGPLPHANKSPLLSAARLRRKLRFWLTGKW
jgi:hypothetical protein